MTVFAIVFLLINATLLLLLPRRWAPLPILIGSCYMTLGQRIELGPLTFTVIRMILLVGFVRVVVRGERLVHGLNGLDWLMLFWAGWALTSSAFHRDPSAALVFRLGLVYDVCGIYFMFRVLCQSMDDVMRLYCMIAILLSPVAFEMVYEKLTAHNLFSALGGVTESPAIREGKIRAQGPFLHAILAGTVGAVCLPQMIGLWQQYRKLAIAGILACLTMVFACSSSGPIMSALAAIGALFMWRYRHNMRLVRWLVVFGYIGLDVVMKDQAYYILARIDLTGGSTGWHRAYLIEMAFKHLNEWWIGGTDYTRHWMPTGVSWSPDHTDITNYYLKMGVIGGLPLMILLIIIFVRGFSYIGQALRSADDLSPETSFILWTLGASLFAHAATGIAVSYFDQSFIFLYLTLGVIGSAWSWTMTARYEEKSEINKYFSTKPER